MHSIASFIIKRKNSLNFGEGNKININDKNENNNIC